MGTNMTDEEKLIDRKEGNDSSLALGLRFYRFLFSNSLSSISWSLFFLFFMWKVISEYHSVFLAGMLATIFMIVELVSSVPIGHMIDKLNNTVLNVSASLIMALVFSLFIFGFSVYFVYAATAIISLGYTMKGDSFAAIIKKHIKEEGVSKATSYQQASNNFSTLIGLALGGVSLVLLSHIVPFILLGLAMVSAVLSKPVKEEKPEVVETQERANYGYREVFSFFRKIIWFSMIALVLNGFFVALDVYGAGLFKMYLDAGPVMYTIFLDIIPAGAFAGSIVSSKIMSRIDRPISIAALTLVFAPVLVTLGMSRSPVLDIAAAGILGFILPLINVPLMSRLVKATPSEMFGKVFAFLRIFLGSSAPVMATVFSFLSLFFPLTSVLSVIGLLMVPVSLLSFGVIKSFYSTTVKNSLDSGAEPLE